MWAYFFLTNNYPAKIVGQYDFIRSFLLVIGSFTLLGTDQSILYFAGRLRSYKSLEEIKLIYWKMIKIILSLSFIIYFAFLLIDKDFLNNYFNDNNVYNLLLKGIFVLFFYCLTLLNTEVFRAINFLVLSEIFRNIIKYLPTLLGAIMLLILDREDLLLSFFLYGFIFTGVLSTFIVYLIFKKINNDLVSETILLREVISRSYPIAISSMAIFLLMSFDIMFLKKFKNDATVAYYSVAVKLMMILSIIINTININVSSKISELFNSQKIEELNSLLKHSSRLIFILSLPLVLFILVFSKEILALFGNNYIASNTALLIMIFTQGICTLFGSVGVYLNMTGKQKIFQNILLFSVLINFLLNRLLIPKYGMTGAAIAFSVSLFLWNFISCLIIYKKDKVKIFIR
ncbi:MATE family efflux transporter [Mariniflexile aquimaris]|uniref:MATE family efflux transporter n=1 Tax=Mariniflexile aquimaris TaxID=881009 RepID=A0ABW3BPY8_9FLAO